MGKIVNFSHTLSELNFTTPHHDRKVYYDYFLTTNIGRMYLVIPWEKLLGLFLEKKKSQVKRGRPLLFDLRGQLALMFLKAYTGYSDRKLIERLNTDYSLQFFCGIYLRPGQQIDDFKIVSSIRSRLGSKLSIEKFQQVLADHWRPWLKDRPISLTDATCYETNIRYPTDVKLTWEANRWIYAQMKLINKYRKGRMPRSKFAEQKSKYLFFQKKQEKALQENSKTPWQPPLPAQQTAQPVGRNGSQPLRQYEYAGPLLQAQSSHY